MDKQYNPASVEEKIYQTWLENKCFHGNENSEKEKYSIVIPPPNVTGILHMGHALNSTIQDILIRYKRMDGFETLWIPGTDHAGIATQNVVERKIATEGKTRHDYGREKFIKKVWSWKEEYHSTITNQLKKLGVSCDWDRERFTMDEGLSDAVKKVFVKLYQDGLIYRGKYIINWCPRCRTALSDEEAEHKDHKSHLWHFKYPLSDGLGYIEVATTRPETMLGDTAVAVNPKDDRYTDLVGKMLTLPLANRKIPIISDDFVKREFGTGAVKVTPAHDPNDYNMGMRHDMEPIVVMDEGAKMCGNIPKKYIGMDRFEARKAIVDDMKVAGFLIKIEDHDHAVGECYRCHTVVEPYYSDQWFVKMKPLAKKSLEAAVENKINFYPSRWKQTYIDWMENIRDWCISRQIWWGHRIPVWYCGDCNELTVAQETPRNCCKCNSTNLTQDEDVLDTWFSSWLWPFSTMGWPKNTATLEKFYPTDTLATAPEILFFWVARMVMAGIYCVGELPYKDIILHGTVRDETGRKMSKSLGNSIDPLKIIDEFGADALRFSIMVATSQGSDLYLHTGKDEKKSFEIGRNFANKFWNASRFLLGNITEDVHFNNLPKNSDLKTEDVWILSKYNKTIKEYRVALDTFRTNDACKIIYDFTWNSFCNWYIEAKKSDFYQNKDIRRKENALNICTYVFTGILKMLHPIMPYITEEIWSHLIRNVSYDSVIDSPLIISASMPVCDEQYINENLEIKFDLLQDIITALRTTRSENAVPPEKKGTAIVIPETNEIVEWLKSQEQLINLFAKLSKTTIGTDIKKPDFAGQSVVKGIQVFIELEGLINKEVEIERITKEITHLTKISFGIKKKLENKSFVDRAPEAVVAKEKDKQEGILLSLTKLQNSLEKMQK